MHADDIAEQEKHEQLRYLAVINFKGDRSVGGYALQFYPDERLAIYRELGLWPSRRVLGEFATVKEAQAAVVKRMDRFVSGLRAWETYCKRRGARRRRARRQLARKWQARRDKTI
jgi:hypothetical protein